MESVECIGMRAYPGEPLSASRLRRIRDEQAPLLLQQSPVSPPYIRASSSRVTIDDEPLPPAPSLSNGHARSEHGETDNEVDEEVHSMFHKEPFVVPNKSQVLFYFSSTNSVKIARAGNELQVTDMADFPLFDVWTETLCAWSPGPWVIEAYGRRVLRMEEGGGEGGGVPCLRRPSLPVHISLTDWNGDLIGFFSPGDPYLIKGNDRVTLARCIHVDAARNERKKGEDAACREVWECVLEGCERCVARLERGRLRFLAPLGFQLKLLILACLVRISGTPSARRSCWPFG